MNEKQKKQIRENYEDFASREIEVPDHESATKLTKTGTILFYDEIDDWDCVFQFHIADTVSSPVFYVPGNNWNDALAGLLEAFPPALEPIIIDRDDPDYQGQINAAQAGELNSLRLTHFGEWADVEAIIGAKITHPESIERLRA